MKISKNWELTILPVTKLVRTDTNWEPKFECFDDKGSFKEYSRVEGLSKESRPAVPVRSIMFGNCDKYHRCPNWACGGRINWGYSAMLQFCNECGTLVLPYKMKYFNPEEISYFFSYSIPQKFQDFKEDIFWWLADRYGYEEVKKYYNPFERKRKRVLRKNKSK